MDTEDVKAAAAAKIKASKAKITGATAERETGELGAVLPREIWEVRGPEGGRRRGNLRFTPVPLRVDTADLSASQRRAIVNDPALSVRVVETVAVPAAVDPPAA